MAVQAVVGTVVDGETLIENDDLIRDKVLTYSNGFVTSYDRLSESQQDGLFRTRIRATVARNKLIVRLENEKIITRKVEGRGLFAEAVTTLQREKDAAQIMRRVFEGFPGTVLKADAVGEPRIIDKSENKATVGITVRFSVDQKAYSKWIEASKPILSKLADRESSYRWNAAQFSDPLLRPRSLIDPKVSQYWRFEQLSVPWNERSGDSWGTLSLSQEAIRNGFQFPGAIGRTLFSPEIQGKNALLILDRPGNGRINVYELTERAYAPAVHAVLSLPIVTVVLKSDLDKEVAGMERVAFFGDNSTHAFHATLFWELRWQNDGYQFLKPLPLSLHMDASYWLRFKPHSQQLEGELALLRASVRNLLVAPHFGAVSASRYPAFIGAFQNEFTFVLPLGDLQQITRVEVTVSSENRLLPTDDDDP
ncbi:MAG: hypothetical protein ACYTG0_21925 [Planctomycetota bacterium]